jgi:hypothetical protein
MRNVKLRESRNVFRDTEEIYCEFINCFEGARNLIQKGDFMKKVVNLLVS